MNLLMYVLDTSIEVPSPILTDLEVRLSVQEGWYDPLVAPELGTVNVSGAFQFHLCPCDRVSNATT